jgi:hypothetical protein
MMLILSTSNSFAQHIKVDTVNFVKPGVEEIILDTSITNSLESFNDKDDAIIYFYRLSAMAGAAVKWEVKVGDNEVAKLAQKEYLVEHINTTEKSHWVTYPNMKVNYVNFKPNRYYMIRLKGFSMDTGYLDPITYSEIKTCKRYKPSAK